MTQPATSTYAVYRTVAGFMKGGMTFNEAIAKLESILHGKLDADLIDRVKAELNFPQGG